MTPSPFEISQNVGNRLAKSSRRRRDLSALDEILSNAANTNDPAKIREAFGEIISRVSPERQPAAMKVLEGKLQNLQAVQQLETAQASDVALGQPKEFTTASPAAQKAFIESKKAPTPALKLNEELNQQRSRSKTKIDNIIRPWGLLDPFTRMITWNKDVTEEKRKEIEDKVAAISEKDAVTQRKLYKRYGQPIPYDLFPLDQNKVSEAVRLLEQQAPGE